MRPEEWIQLTDGGTTIDKPDTPDMETLTVHPEEIAVDPMNERVDQPLELEDLERSVAKLGVVEDPVCRVLDEDAKVKYGVLQGQRRVIAAQNMQLDEIRISVGDFDDLTAIKRSITENINSTKSDVTTKARARAIGTMWELMKKTGETDSENKLPKAPDIANALGVPRQTVNHWIEPLRSQWKDTSIDPNVNDSTDHGGQISEKLDDISTRKLEAIRQISSEDNPQEAMQLLLEGEESEFLVSDYRELVKLQDSNVQIDDAIETVKQSKEAAQQAKSYTLNMMRFGGTTGGAIRKAARATGKDEKVVVKDAVGYYLREEGYL